jgi:hypothetical protein
MGRSTHLRDSFAAAVGALLLAGALVAGCGDDGGGDGATTDATTTTASTTSAPVGDDGGTTTAAPTTTQAPGTLIEITVVDGEVTGGGRISVDQDEPVTVRITSDADDEAHVHGFDLTLPLVAGEPAELVFTPDASGIYEVELHDAGTLLFELEVR